MRPWAWILIALWTGVLLFGCTHQDEIETSPSPPSRAVVDQYDVDGETVFEFRDSAGRICVKTNMALSCGYPRDYNQEKQE